jgi:hypothetical protein
VAGEAVHVSIGGELVADVSPASLWHRAPVLDALRLLANARARVVKEALVANGIAEDRFFLVAPRLGGDAAGSGAAGTPALVDLALR